MNFHSPRTFPKWVGTASRRHFLSSASTVAMMSLVGSWSGWAESGPSVMKERPSEELRLATFTGQLQTDFSVTDAPVGCVAMRLIEARPGKTIRPQNAEAPDAEYEKFSLMFRGPKSPLLAQRIYRFEHPRIGWFEMFIVPVVTEGKNRQHYQAVFNRPVPTR